MWPGTHFFKNGPRALGAASRPLRYVGRWNLKWPLTRQASQFQSSHIICWQSFWKLGLVPWVTSGNKHRPGALQPRGRGHGESLKACDDGWAVHLYFLPGRVKVDTEHFLPISGHECWQFIFTNWRRSVSKEHVRNAGAQIHPRRADAIVRLGRIWKNLWEDPWTSNTLNNQAHIAIEQTCASTNHAHMPSTTAPSMASFQRLQKSS